MAKSKFWNGSAWEVLGTDADKITETVDHKVMTAVERTKLSGIAAGAQVNVPTNIAQGTRTTTTVPITSSTGTGATLSAATTSLAGVMTSADKTKLDTLQSPVDYTATITTTWEGASPPYTQNVTVSGIIASDVPLIFPVYSTTNTTAILQKEAWNMISGATTSANTITFTCFEEKPVTAIPIQIRVVR